MDKKSLARFEKQIKDLSSQETRELLIINTYKLALLKCHVEALTDIITKNKLATREQIWKMTTENFDDSTI